LGLTVTVCHYPRGCADLSVTAYFDEGVYPKGKKVGADEVAQLALTPHVTCPKRNYTLGPRDGKA
jgi:hypothetical protein